MPFEYLRKHDAMKNRPLHYLWTTGKKSLRSHCGDINNRASMSGGENQENKWLKQIRKLNEN